VACERDLEGIVGKWADGTYRTDGRATSWLKVKNRDYTQTVNRHERFAARQGHEGRPRSMAYRVDLVLR
jgi:ATP-dependent DNA ligase